MADHNKKAQGGSKHAHSTSGTMTHQQAGHLGGVAPHACRGGECHKKSAHPGSHVTAEKKNG